MKKYLNVLALSAGLCFVGAVSVQAQLIAYEDFNYPQATPSSTTLAGQNGGSGNWNGAWTDKNFLTYVVPGMTYSTLPTSGNSIFQQGSSTASSQAERVLNANFGTYATANTYEANTIWMSYLWNGVTTSPTGNTFRQASMMFLVGGSPTTGGGSEYLDVGMPNISSTTVGTVNPNVSLWYGGHGLAGQTGSASAPNVQSGVAANSGATDFILIQMIADASTTTADTMNIWINPALTGATPVGAPDMTYTLQDLSAINTIRIQAGSINTSGTGEEQADEIRFGWTANAVETMSVANVVLVPEPVSMVLLGFSSLSLLLFRRKN